MGNAYVRRNVGIGLDDGTNASYNLRFQKSPLDNGNPDSVVAGTSYIKVYHPTATTWILEPESPDSLFAWGELSTALETKEYIDLRVLDPLAEEMLAKDPKMAAEWRERLKDPKFAEDTRARHRFFYERTPYWDDTVGLVPVYRLDAPLALSESASEDAAAAPR